MGKTSQTRRGAVTGWKQRSGAHSTRDGGCQGDAQHRPFPQAAGRQQAGSGVRAAASCPLHPHGIPAPVSHRHLMQWLPCDEGLLDRLPAAWLKFTAKPRSKPSPSSVLICFLFNLSVFSRKWLMALKFETQTQSLQDPVQSDASPGAHQPRGRGATQALAAERSRGLGQGCSFPPLPPPPRGDTQGRAGWETWHWWGPPCQSPGNSMCCSCAVERQDREAPATARCPGKALTQPQHGQTPLLPPPATFRASNLSA